MAVQYDDGGQTPPSCMFAQESSPRPIPEPLPVTRGTEPRLQPQRGGSFHLLLHGCLERTATSRRWRARLLHLRIT
jgi:hypothetical protein